MQKIFIYKSLLLLSSVIFSWGTSGYSGPGKTPTDIALVQNLNQNINKTLIFKDSENHSITLGKYFNKGRPLILVPVYFTCPDLCSLTLENLVTTLKKTPLQVGTNFDVVVVSFSQGDNPNSAKTVRDRVLKNYYQGKTPKLNPTGWHFLTGDSTHIKELMQEIGFKYSYDSSSEKYQHASVILIATSEAKISQYLYGVSFKAKDIESALTTATSHKIGNVVDQFLLYCFHYDPEVGAYSLRIMNITRVIGVLTILLLGIGIGVMLRQSNLKQRRQNA